MSCSWRGQAAPRGGEGGACTPPQTFGWGERLCAQPGVPHYHSLLSWLLLHNLHAFHAFHLHARPVLQPRGRLRQSGTRLPVFLAAPRGSAFPSIPHCEVLRCSECHCSRPAHAVYSTTADVRPACTLFVQSTGISSSCRQPLPCRPRRLMGPPCQPRHAAKRVVGGQGWSVATAAVGPWLPHLCLYLHRRIEH